jgi:hypothetical protein
MTPIMSDRGTIYREWRGQPTVSLPIAWRNLLSGYEVTSYEVKND